jgi:hypothetical protein
VTEIIVAFLNKTGKLGNVTRLLFLYRLFPLRVRVGTFHHYQQESNLPVMDEGVNYCSNPVYVAAYSAADNIRKQLAGIAASCFLEGRSDQDYGTPTLSWVSRSRLLYQGKR